MKHAPLFFFSLTLSILSCSKDVQPQRGFTLHAAYTPQTRTVMDGTGSVIWQLRDSVGVFSDGEVYPCVAAEAGASVNFTGDVPPSESHYILYPYSPDAVISGNRISAVIPSLQEPLAGSFARKANVAAALSSLAPDGITHEAMFYNAGAYIRLNVGTEDVSRLVIRSRGGEKLSGNVEITVASRTEVSAAGGDRDSVVLRPFGGAGCFAPGSYYAVVVPGTLSGGLRISVYHPGGEVENYNFESAASLEKNSILNITSELGGNMWNTWTDAESLKALLLKAPAKGKVYTSQYSYYDYTSSKTIENIRRTIYGGYPLMYGADFYRMTGTFYDYGYRNKCKTFFLSIVREAWAKNRAIPLVNWHLESPYADPSNPELAGSTHPYQYCYQNRSDYPSFPVEHRYIVNEILNNTGQAVTGQTCGDWFDDRVREVAAIINQVTMPDGTPIPMIFRLWHELEDWWAWWQVHDIQGGAATYAQFYRFTVDKIREYCPGHPILFVYCTDYIYSGAEFSKYMNCYPGDDYVDILAYDDYTIGSSTADQSMCLQRARNISSLARSRGKIAMLCETLRSASESVPSQATFFQNFVAPIVSDSQTSLSIFQCWGGADNTDFRKQSFAWWYANEMTIFNK